MHALTVLWAKGTRPNRFAEKALVPLRVEFANVVKRQGRPRRVPRILALWRCCTSMCLQLGLAAPGLVAGRDDHAWSNRNQSRLASTGLEV